MEKRGAGDTFSRGCSKMPICNDVHEPESGAPAPRADPHSPNRAPCIRAFSNSLQKRASLTKTAGFYFTMILSSLAGENLGTLLALILISSPVLGFLPFWRLSL